MGKQETKPTRKHGIHLRVPVLPNEEYAIKSNASNAGLSIAEYLRRIGMGCHIHSTIDKDYIHQLAKINADMGRVGGLLKLWLSQDQRVAHFNHQTVTTLLNKIRTTQDAMLTVVKKL